MTVYRNCDVIAFRSCIQIFTVQPVWNSSTFLDFQTVYEQPLFLIVDNFQQFLFLNVDNFPRPLQASWFLRNIHLMPHDRRLQIKFLHRKPIHNGLKSFLKAISLFLNPTTFNVIRWNAGSIVSSTKRLMVQVLFCQGPFLYYVRVF